MGNSVFTPFTNLCFNYLDTLPRHREPIIRQPLIMWIQSIFLSSFFLLLCPCSVDELLPFINLIFFCSGLSPFPASYNSHSKSKINWNWLRREAVAGWLLQLMGIIYESRCARGTHCIYKWFVLMEIRPQCDMQGFPPCINMWPHYVDNKNRCQCKVWSKGILSALWLDLRQPKQPCALHFTYLPYINM